MAKSAPSIGIIGGNGRMGKLFADFFRERGLEVLISDLKTKISNKEVAKKSDITIISVPIDKTVEVIKEVLPCVKKGSAITDFTSVKEIPVSEMMKAKSGVEVFGMHPMFGNSNPIPGQTVLLCPTKKSGKWYKWMKEFLDKNSAITKVMTPKEHDQIMAIAQDLIHFVEITCADGLRLTGLPVKEILPFISKASELKVMSSARILDQDAGLYGNMQMQNPYNLKFLNNYKKTVENLIEIIGKKDLNSFKKYFAKTNKYLGKYAEEAYKDSSFLIDELIESRNREQSKKNVDRRLSPNKNDIALLGPKHTFSDLAATKYLENCNSPKYYTKTIEEVFELVEQGKVAQGIVPIENKLDGTIRETLDNLFTEKVHIVSSLELPIHHCLAILPFSTPADIQKIISHEQALNQSKKYLKKHFATVDKEAYSSTTSAIEKLIFSNDKSLAVVVSKQAAQNYDLKIIAENIEDENSNSTKFIVIKKGDYTAKNSVQKNSTKHSKNLKTSIAFHFDKDSPGSLFSVLEDFAKAKINLTKIESRPTKKEFGDYIFYLDFDGSPENPKTKEILKNLRKKVATFKVLGTASRE